MILSQLSIRSCLGVSCAVLAAAILACNASAFAQQAVPVPHISVVRPSSAPADLTRTEGQLQSRTMVQSNLTPVNTGPGIVYTCASNVATATCNYLNMTVAGYYNDTFTNANSNIYVQYGNTDLGGSEYYFNFVTYNQYVSAYNSIPSKSPIQISANSSLSTYDASPYGSDYVWIQPGIARALGITSEVQGACIGCNLPATGITPSGSNCTAGTAGCYDGIITITNNGGITLYYDDLGGSEPSGAYDFYAVVEHETDEVLGTSSCITTETSPLSNACNTDGSAGSGLLRRLICFVIPRQAVLFSIVR